jgi:hypothetical protein
VGHAANMLLKAARSNPYIGLTQIRKIKALYRTHTSLTVGTSAFPSVKLNIPHHIEYKKESINRNYNNTKQIIPLKIFLI